MINRIYFLLDKKSNSIFHTFVCPNDATALRGLASELKELREKKVYSIESCWADSELCVVDLTDPNKLNLSRVDAFRGFFNAQVSEVKQDAENKNAK